MIFFGAETLVRSSNARGIHLSFNGKVSFDSQQAARLSPQLRAKLGAFIGGFHVGS